MMFISVMISFFVFAFFLFCILLFPVFDDNLLVIGTKIDRFSMSESFIEFLYIILGDILLPSCYKMSFDHIREGINEDIKWFSIIFGMFLFVWFHCFLERMDNIGWLTRIPQYE